MQEAQHAAERQATEAERAQQAREAEVERRAEEGPYDSDAVEDMCWTTIEARAEAEFTAQANRGDAYAWYKYNLPTRFSGTRS